MNPDRADELSAAQTAAQPRGGRSPSRRSKPAVAGTTLEQQTLWR
ncbi:hypothetical protein [Nodosilinea sp. PGN35]|nr:hypothetical protein [Nodosilinea sp. TSF1-S3]MDF0370011.1 hypothetical protein [Nodosilinea sp. TSF1-S3]